MFFRAFLLRNHQCGYICGWIRRLNTKRIQADLLNAIVIDPPDKEAAWKLCLSLKENGLLAKPTHSDKIRLAPPLIITKDEIKECVDIIRNSLENFE